MEYIRQNERRVLRYFDAGVDGSDPQRIKIRLEFDRTDDLRGFWICRRNIFAPEFPWERYAKGMNPPGETAERQADGAGILGEMPEFLLNPRFDMQMQTIIYKGIRYKFAWLRKDGFIRRNREIGLQFGSDPARVSVLWVDRDGNVHEEPNCEKTLPIRISYTRRVVRVGSGFDVEFSFARSDEICGDALYYTVDGKAIRYPIPEEIIRGGEKLRFIQCEGVSIHLKERYQDILSLDEG